MECIVRVVKGLPCASKENKLVIETVRYNTIEFFKALVVSFAFVAVPCVQPFVICWSRCFAVT